MVSRHWLFCKNISSQVFDRVTPLNCTKNISEVITNHNRACHSEELKMFLAKKRNVHYMGSTTLATSSKNMRHQHHSNSTIHQHHLEMVKGVSNHEASKRAHQKELIKPTLLHSKRKISLIHVQSGNIWVSSLFIF